MVNPWALHRLAAARKSAGEAVVLLGMGEPDTPSAPAALEAVQAAVARGEEGYAEGLGLPELRAALAERLGAAGTDCVSITCGAQTALFIAVSMLCRRFRERACRGGAPEGSAPLVLTPTPLYATYEHTVAMAGGRLLAVPQPASDDFRLSPASLDAALAAHPGAAAAILITNPHNPTGHLIGADTLAELGATCERHDVTLIADEVYGALVYGDNPQARLFRSCTAVPGLCQRAIGLGSFSKIGLRPGWRVGWMAVPPALQAAAQAESEAVLYGVSPLTQHAALAVMPLLAPGNAEAARYAARLAALLAGLGGSALVRPIVPQAGMFVLVDVCSASGAPGGLAFAEALLDGHGFSVLPGEAFGAELAPFIRVGLLAAPEDMRAAGRAIVACAQSFQAASQGQTSPSPGGQTGGSGADVLDGARAAVVCGGPMNVDWGRDIAARLAAAAPEAHVAVWTADEPEAAAAAAVAGADALFVYDPPPGLWAAAGDRLRLVCGMASGTDHLRAAGDLPPGVALCRLLDPLAPQRMGHFVVHALLSLALGAPEMARQQRAGQWEPTATGLPRDPQDMTVGVLGFGACGSAAAAALVRTGFRVVGWSRSPRPAASSCCEVMAGRGSLEPFLRRAQVLVAILPLKEDTRGLLDASRLRMLPAGASLVNCGRAEVVVQEDVLALLDAGHLGEAVLDVTSPEPPPPGSPLWHHPRVRLSPHIAGRMTTAASCGVLLDNWRATRRGEPPRHPVQPGDL